MITSEGSAQLKMFGFDGWMNNNACYRKTIAHTLGHCVDIGWYTGVVVAKEFSAPSITALYTIGNINGPIGIATLAYRLQKFIFSYMNASYALNAFYNNCGNFVAVFCKMVFQRLAVIEW